VKSIMQWLGIDRPPPEPAHAEALRAIVDSLDRLEPERAKYLAAFAFLLGRVAHADSHVSPEETETMERLVREKSGLSEEHGLLVVQTARINNLLFGGTANFLVAREFERLASYPERLALVDCLFAVSSAHEGVATIEDNEIRRISRELKIEHADYIAVRSRYRDYLNVLKTDEQ
jgi:uncharacterized tellurite resistance protein B-like protein